MILKITKTSQIMVKLFLHHYFPILFIKLKDTTNSFYNKQLFQLQYF